MFHMRAVALMILIAGTASRVVRKRNIFDEFQKISLETYTTIEPEANMDIVELVESKGYKFEKHSVQTKDGYILELHRMFNTTNLGKRPPPVLLMHGFLGASTDWLVNHPNQSLGYILADAGYDVWMGNVRGNRYSRKHVRLPVDGDEFWDFCMDEHIQVDLETMVDKVLSVTANKQLNYIGYSQGSTMLFGKLALDPAYSQKIINFYAMAPGVYSNLDSGVIGVLSDGSDLRQVITTVLGNRGFLDNLNLMKLVGSTVCKGFTAPLCNVVISLVCGETNRQEFNLTRMPVYMANIPAGSSMKNIRHYLQPTAGAMYDYGKTENQKHYRQDTPPAYDITKITGPRTTILYGEKDLLTTETKSLRIASEISTVLAAKHRIAGYQHLDFIWGMNAKAKVYDIIIDDMEKTQLAAALFDSWV